MNKTRFAAAALAVSLLFPASGFAEAPGAPGVPYAGMSDIAPIGVRTDRYFAIPEAAKGPAIDPKKGYRIEDLGGGVYMITDNAISSMFMVYEQGVVVVDAPQAYADKIVAGVREVTDKPITHLIYSHSHADHIGGAKVLGPVPVIIAHEETKRLMAEANDPARPLPTVTFKDNYTLKVGSKVLQLSYHGYGHEPGNIFIYAPQPKVLMVVDTIFPGWMPWRRMALAQNMRGLFRNVAEIEAIDFDKFIGGHVSRWGTKADVRLQLDFMEDLRAAAADALANTRTGEQIDLADTGNPWAVFDNYIDRVANRCVNTLEPKWRDRLAGYDVFIWDQCYAMEQSLRID